LKDVEANSVSSNVHFFDTSSDSPRPLEEVRIQEVRADLLPDGRRVVISLTLTPCFEKPNIDVTLLRDGVEERTLSVIGAMDNDMQLTLHLPAGDASGAYTARVDLVRDAAVQQTATIAFEVPRATS
jgi:hypothetical protein